jgi:outer membrane protein
MRPVSRVLALAAGWVVLVAPALGGQGVAGDATADGARPIALDEAVRLAQHNAPLSVQARGQLRTASAQVRSAYASFLPNFNVSLGGVRQFAADRVRINPQTGVTETLSAEDWSYSNGLALGVDIFDGGRRFHDVGAAKAGVSAADANDVLQRFRVALEVKQQFYNVLAAREREGAARAQLEQATQQLRAATARVAAGAATKSDSLRSVILVGDAQLAALTAQNDLRVANAALTRLVGSAAVVTAAPADTLLEEAVGAPLDSAALLALAERGPGVAQAEASSGAARAQRRAARSPYLPTISANYSRNGSGFDSRYGFGNDPFAYQGSLRLALSYPLFNQLTREAEVVRSDVAAENANAALRDARLQARQSLTQFLGALRTAEQRVLIQLASVAAAEEDLRVQQQRYALGASTLLDQLTSQTQLNQSRAALIQARYDARVARAQIEALVGRETAS